jgi:hypothetical protein
MIVIMIAEINYIIYYTCFLKVFKLLIKFFEHV